MDVKNFQIIFNCGTVIDTMAALGRYTWKTKELGLGWKPLTLYKSLRKDVVVRFKKDFVGYSEHTKLAKKLDMFVNQVRSKFKILDAKIKEASNAALENITKPVTNLLDDADFDFGPSPLPDFLSDLEFNTRMDEIASDSNH